MPRGPFLPIATVLFRPNDDVHGRLGLLPIIRIDREREVATGIVSADPVVSPGMDSHPLVRVGFATAGDDSRPLTPNIWIHAGGSVDRSREGRRRLPKTPLPWRQPRLPMPRRRRWYQRIKPDVINPDGILFCFGTPVFGRIVVTLARQTASAPDFREFDSVQSVGNLVRIYADGVPI
jgi:hypothetical protein